MAFIATAARSIRRRGGRLPLRPLLNGVCVLCVSLGALYAAPASAQKANISGLSDLTFTSVNFSGVNSSMSEDICVYSSTSPENYQITATGSGTGGSFTLASGSDTLAYQVAWNSSPGQTNGTPLSANAPSTTQSSSAAQKTCNSGPATSASLIVTIPYSAVDAATAGNYSGTLNLTVIPE